MRCAVVENQRLDVTALGVLLHLIDLAFDAPDAEALRDPAQILPVSGGIEMIGVVERRPVGIREFLRPGGLMFEAIFADLTGPALAARLEPEVMEVRHPGSAAKRPERVHVAVAVARPIFKADTELESRSRRLDELALVHAHVLVESPAGGDRGFADADGPDIVRFDERDVDQRADLLRKRECCDPACRAAPRNDHPIYFGFVHLAPS